MGDMEKTNTEPVVLDGKSLTFDKVERIAKYGAEVSLDPSAEAVVERAHRALADLAAKDIPIYGLNRGVGVNKDRLISADFFEAYNRNLIYSHSSGVEPIADDEQIRAIMAVRLNTLLCGGAGVQPAVVQMYRDMLNKGVHPVLPLRGSVGAADITLLSHIGLAMIGEGEVRYGGEVMPAEGALAEAGLAKLRLGPKDGLAIVSSNALSAGTGALVLSECRKLLETADTVYALSLEAFRGSMDPLDEAVYRVRPFEGASESAATVRRLLHGGDLKDTDTTERIQDPLSFRSACQVHGAARDALAYSEKQLLIQLNSSDDNPCLLADEGRIVPNSNFDVTTWAVAFEMLSIALSHVSKISCYRSIKLGTPSFTGLARFLSPDPDKAIGFGTIQKTFTSLDAEIRQLSNPVSADYFSLSGDMEDHASNAPLAVRKTGEIIRLLYYILGIEAMHAAQAVDLRNGLRLGEGTQKAYAAVRSAVPYLSADRPLTPDIEAMAKLLKTGALCRIISD